MDSSPSRSLTSPPPRSLRVGVSVQNVAKSFGDHSVLKSVDLELAPGSFHVLIGPSGCGKTTLLRMIGGLENPTHGAVLFTQFGQNMTQASFVPSEFSGLSYGFQEPRLLPWLSVAENIALPLTLRDAPLPLVSTRVREILSQMRLGHSAHLYPHQLSGGMKMRVAIGRSIVNQPQVLLLDEPFGALDEITKNRLDDELYHLWRSLKMTVVLVTHSLSEAVYLGEHIHVLSAITKQVAGSIHVNLGDRSPETRLTTAFTETLAETHALLRSAEGGDV